MSSNKKQNFEVGEEVGQHHIKYLREGEPYIYEKTGKKYRRAYFLCPLCGEEFLTRVSKVKNGLVKCCGCIRRLNCGLNNGHSIDLTGQRFGFLTALYPTDKRQNGKIMWHCRCDCGTEFDVTSAHLQSKHTISCGCKKSKGELKISNILNEQNIRYKKEHTFEGCINPVTGRKLKFDFYLLDLNILIEYDGKQHFITEEKGWYSVDDLKDIQRRDEIKNNYCLEHDIPLIRINYSEYDLLNTEFLLERINACLSK